jgi:hypothetical protein
MAWFPINSAKSTVVIPKVDRTAVSATGNENPTQTPSTKQNTNPISGRRGITTLIQPPSAALEQGRPENNLGRSWQTLL